MRSVVALLVVVLACADRARAEPPQIARDPASARPLTMDEALARKDWTLRAWFNVAATTTPGLSQDARSARGIDEEAEGVVWHQGYLALERATGEGRGWGWGAKAALLIGEDARLTHARGLLDDQDGSVQVDLFEAWASVRAPVAHGLTLKVGKLATPLGYEVVEAALDFLPSRSVTFGYGLPFTHTGAFATLALSPRVSIGYGLVLGWDVWDDPNDALTHLVTCSVTSGRDTFVVGTSLGAEAPGDDDHLRFVIDGTWSRKWSACVETALNLHLGSEEAAAAGEGASWWATALYATWRPHARRALGARIECFRDEDGARVGQEATLLGLTLGYEWTVPLGTLTAKLRPEVRYDRSLDGDLYDGGRDADQVALTLDLLVDF